MSKALRFLAGLSAVIVPAAISIYAYSKYNDDTKGSELESKKNKKASVTILYGTTTNTAKDYAERLCKRINANPLLQSNYNAQALNLVEYNHEDKFHKEDIVFIICSTWTDGTAPESCREFFTWLEDFAYDFRVSKDHLSNLRFAIFGLGSAYYDVDYCKHLYKAHEQMVELSAKPLEDVRRGDDQTDLDNKFDKWEREIMAILRHLSPVQETEMETGTGTGGKIVNKGGNSKVKVASTSSIKKSKTGPKGSDSRGNAFQRQQAVANGTYIPPIVEDDSSDDETSRDAAKANAQSGGANEDVEEEEEDRLNNMFVTMDHVDEADSKRIMSTMSSSTAAVTATDGSENLLPPEAEYDDSDSDSDAEDKDNKSGEKHKTAQTGLQDEVVDMEDLHKGKKNSSDGDTTADAGGSSCGSGGGCGSSEEKVSSKKEPLEMVTKLQRKALTKEGYRIIGTHSAVKLCRWTKNQMRGRGGCYKHTFYGITSYQCMEATPSLACANKCVFCWRHHKNPVGTEWRWKEDDPAFIVDEAVELHRAMINEMRGVPGVKAERLADGFNVKHCALSLVGEPIMYPRINEMMMHLHNRQISTFLVTNAQFPKEISALEPVTQLYVSVDASNKDSLKAIDRPLFRDFWERFTGALKELARKRQRTVYRLTLVEGWNMDEVEGYAELVETGKPDFIEIKAVTYCGKSDASSLTMQNVPWHKDVVDYAEAITSKLRERGICSVNYSIATEHEHSCCVLLAREDKFKIKGRWHTWIDYDKFNTLISKFYESKKQIESGESNELFAFTSEDYMVETPEWAVYKNALNTKGFDPIESRWKRTKTGKMVEIDYKSSDSGCG